MNKSIDQEECKKEVVEGSGLSLVQFKSEWSGACQLVSLIYEDLSRTYKGAVKFYVVDIDEQTTLNKEYGINDIPTILFFKGGQIVDYATGLIPKNVLISKIENALAD
jgi:thioredoxin 1